MHFFHSCTLSLKAQNHIDSLHDVVLFGVVGVVLGRNLQQCRNHLFVIADQMADVVCNLCSRMVLM